MKKAIPTMVALALAIGLSANARERLDPETLFVLDNSDRASEIAQSVYAIEQGRKIRYEAFGHIGLVSYKQLLEAKSPAIRVPQIVRERQLKVIDEILSKDKTNTVNGTYAPCNFNYNISATAVANSTTVFADTYGSTSQSPLLGGIYNFGDAFVLDQYGATLDYDVYSTAGSGVISSNTDSAYATDSPLNGACESISYGAQAAYNTNGSLCNSIWTTEVDDNCP